MREEIKQAMGKVRTRKDGIRCARIVRTDIIPTPFDTKSSTRRNISFVNIMKHRAPKLTIKGVMSSLKI